MTQHARDTGAEQPARSSAIAIEPRFHSAKRFAAHIDDARHMAGSMAISVMLGAGVLLSGCAATPAHESASVYDDDNPASGFLGLDSWGWHGCDCGTFGQLDRTEANGEY